MQFSRNFITENSGRRIQTSRRHIGNIARLYRRYLKRDVIKIFFFDIVADIMRGAESRQGDKEKLSTKENNEH